MVDLYLATAAYTTRRASSFFYHSLNGSSGSVNGDLQFLWRQANFNPLHKINSPEPIDKKSAQLITSARGHPRLYTKFGRNPFAGGFWGKWVKYNKNYFFLFILFFFDQPTGQTRGWIFTRDSSKSVKSRKDVLFGVIKLQPTGQTRGWIFTRDSSKSVKSRKDVLFGVIKLKFNFKPLFIPQNRQILAQNGTQFFSTENA